MPKKLYHVKLTEEQHNHLLDLISKGKHSARKINRARILLQANEGYIDKQIAESLHVSTSTVQRTRQSFAEGGLKNAEKPRPGASPKLDCKDEAVLTAIACSQAPEGRARGTLRLLAFF